MTNFNEVQAFEEADLADKKLNAQLNRSIKLFKNSSLSLGGFLNYVSSLSTKVDNHRA